ncbi:MAG: alpha/beta hydrolase [Herpetosiphonaceae bacterium]|nr:alpha/beta hydrolase [Herpetosiphonaceae bacterium]
MRPLFVVLSVLIGLVVGTSAAMLLLPALNFYLFTLAVGALEWALWFLVAALIGLLLALVGVRSSGALRGAAWLGLVLNLAALLIIGGVWILALRSPLNVRSNMPAVVDAGPGTFSLATFIEGPKTAGEIEIERDVVYATVAGADLKLDIYRAPDLKAAGLHPALVVIHGGSWRTGAKGDVPTFSQALADRGYVVFDVGYRLAPAARFPAAIGDVKCAISYIKTNASTYGIDPNQLVLLGRSAGAQLALVTAYSADSPELPASCPAGDTSVRAVIGYYAPTRMDYYNVIKPELSPGALDDYLGGPPEAFPDQYRLARPVSGIGASTPPTLLLHGSRDQFVRPRDMHELADALAAADRPYTAIEIPWANHGFDYNLTGTSTQRVQPYIDRFLAAVLE